MREILFVCTFLLLVMPGLLNAQQYISAPEQNVEITQTITIRPVNTAPNKAKPTGGPAETADEKAEPGTKPKKKPKTAKKAKTVTQPGKFVPFFQPGMAQQPGTNEAQYDYILPTVAPRAHPHLGRPQPGRPHKPAGPGRRPRGHGKGPLPPPPPPAVQPGRDPRLDNAPTGIKPLLPPMHPPVPGGNFRPFNPGQPPAPGPLFPTQPGRGTPPAYPPVPGMGPQGSAAIPPAPPMPAAGAGRPLR